MADTRSTLKGYFVAGAEPTETQFAATIDGLVSTRDDSVMTGSLELASDALYARGYAATIPSIVTKWPAHTDATAGNATITIAQVLTGILEADSAAQIAWTLPTAALAVAGVTGVAVGDCIDFAVINTSTAGTEEEITVTMGANGTAVGNMVVPGGDTTHDADKSGSGLFRIRFTAVTGTETYTCYRLA
jgi:hypothetical protein|tara:strand:- start:63 stop:629 length:567 start_codon:yes stop_codon:yes gene_type:complete